MSPIQPCSDGCSRGVPYCRCLNSVDTVWKSVPYWGNKWRKCDLCHSFSPCNPILHNVLGLQDFTGNQWKALLLYQLKLLHVFKKCCFNCFDKEINLLPVMWCLCVIVIPLKYGINPNTQFTLHEQCCSVAEHGQSWNCINWIWLENWDSCEFTESSFSGVMMLAPITAILF